MLKAASALSSTAGFSASDVSGRNGIVAHGYRNPYRFHFLTYHLVPNGVDHLRVLRGDVFGQAQLKYGGPTLGKQG
eukprot:jgi/Chlat1/2879/Chrsp195S03020